MGNSGSVLKGDRLYLLLVSDPTVSFSSAEPNTHLAHPVPIRGVFKALKASLYLKGRPFFLGVAIPSLLLILRTIPRGAPARRC